MKRSILTCLFSLLGLLCPLTSWGESRVEASITLNGITYTDQQAVVIKVECIEVTPSELSINTDQTATLTAAVTPATALNTTVHWTSSDEKIATVSEDGVVTPKSDGTAIITASTTDGTDLSSYCTVTVTCSHNGHAYVDLGLPSGTLWATMNVGAVDDANNPIRIKGSCYGWGSTTAITNRRYDSDDYNVTSFVDVASSAFGEGWCMPTKEQWEELLEYGQKVTNSREVYTQDESFFVDTYKGSNGNTIDFPLAGMYSGGEYVPGFGCYWTQTPDGDGQAYYADLHYNPVVISGARYKGLMVRPVLTERAERIYVTAISVTNTETTAVVGSTFTLHADVQPADATTKTVKWSSSDYTIATVSANGEVTILKPGTVTFTATAKDMTGVTGTYTIEAYRPALTSLTISESSYELIQGETTTLEWSYEPAGADVESLTWSSSNESVATVNDKGIVTAVAEGTATITLASAEGPTASCEVTVAPMLTAIALNESALTITEGNDATLSVIYTPANGAHRSVVWTSSDESVATVGEDGLVTAVAVGTAIITATNPDGLTASCEVTVNESCPNNEIWYTATAKLSETTSTSSSGFHKNAFGKTMSSHTFADGKGVIKFSGDITSIGDYAFYGCSGLTSVIIPNSVTSIGNYAFRSCSGLTSVTIPNGVTSIGERTFSGCSGLTSVTIPNSVTSIGYDAFNGCSSLTSVTIPESVTSIGGSAFSGCSGLTSVTIPNSVTSIGNHAFSSCSGLTSVTIDMVDFSKKNIIAKHSDLSNKKFTYLYNGEEIENLVIPEGLTALGEKLFYNCKSLKSVSIPNSVTSIGASAFENCSGLTSVTIPNSVTGIGASAFYGCSGLTSVTIPNSVTSIGASAFYGCSGLTSVTIPNSVTSIGNYAFQNCSGLTSVIIPNSVTSIGNYAFQNCSGLTSVIIPNSVTSIGEYAFYGCSGLTSITIPNSVTSIGTHAFGGCSGLTSITIPNSVTSIGNFAFYGSSRLTSVTLPASLRSIGNSAFNGCSSLTSVTLPASLTSIGNSAFNGCSSLTSVTLPASLTSIGSSAFHGCGSLSELRLTDINAWITNVPQYSSSPLTCNSLPKHLFLNDEEVFDLVILEGVTSIPANAFTSCNFIKTITFPESLVSIADGTGIETNQIERIVLNSNIPPALSSATAISTTCLIMVPAEALNDYKAADYWKDHVTQIIESKENVQFDYDVHVTASATLSALHIAIGEENLPYVQSLKVTGSINSYDIMIINNKMTNLRYLDISDASIVANAYEYRSGYCTKDDELDRYSIPKQLYSLKLPKTLKVLGQYALEGCNQMKNTELILPDGLLSVGTDAFNGSNWSTIVLPESVTKVENNAFNKCNTLRVLTLSYAPYDLKWLGVTTSLEELTVIRGKICDNFAYFQINSSNWGSYTYLRKVTLGEAVTAIGKDAFTKCTALSEFRVNKDMQIGLHAFYQSGIQTLHIPHDCHAVIDKSAFRSVRNLYLDDLDALFTISWVGDIDFSFFTYGSNPINFYVNGKLVEDLVIPEEITELPYAIFRYGTFNTLTLPPVIESIGANVFQGCTALQKVSLPASLKTIGDYAFQGCKAMTEVRLSPSITKIGAQAFNGCTALNDVYTYTIEPQSINETTFSTYATATLHCPAVSYYNYYYDTQWSKFLKLENFDEPYEYVYIAKDFDIYTETAGVISGKPRMDIAAGGGVTVTGNREQELGDVHIMADANSVASLIGNDNLTAENLYLDITVKADYWHFFCFPFDVDLTKVQKEGSYIFRRYDGVLRAQNGGGGWQDIEGTTLHAGEGYIFRTNTAGLLSLPIVAPDLSAKDVATSLEEYASENTADKSWNFIGNPYLAYYDINDIDYTAPIVIWDGTAYTAYRPGDDEYVLQPFQPFFLQRPANVESAGFDTEGRTTYLKSQNAASSANARRAKAQRLNPDRLLINLTLTDGTTTDKARVVFNDKQSLAYEMECDAAKFISTEQVPLLYSLDGEGTKYAINERPVAEGTVLLGFTAPRTGTYTIAATRMDTPVYIEDKVTGEVHFLNDGDFTFHAEEGTDNSRFVLALAAGDITGIGNNEEDADVQAQAPAYDLQGRKVTTPVQGGVYIVNGKKVLFE